MTKTEFRNRVTHQQISEQVGVSRAVVTKALHGTGGARMNAETKEAILRVAQELGYRPRNVTTHNIAYVLPIGALELQGEVSFLRHVEQALRSRGYRLTLINLEKGRAADLREMLSHKVVDGAIFMRWPVDPLEDWFPLDVPVVVTADEDRVSLEVDQVTMGSNETLKRLTDYVLSFGHKKLALVTGPGGISHNEFMKDGVRRALVGAGLGLNDCCMIESFSNRDVAEPLRVAISGENPVTAILCDSPEKATLTLNLLQRWGYSVPEDVSMAVVLDYRHFEALEPAITATTALGVSVAERAVEKLIERINNPDLEPRKEYIAGEILVRESVAAPPKAK